MNCGRARELLIDLLYEELDAEDRAAVVAHLETCPDCRFRGSRLRALADAADRWSAPPVSRGIAERALLRVAAVQRAPRTTVFTPVALVWRIVLGGGAALVSLLLLGDVPGWTSTPVSTGLVAAVWTVLYSGVLLAASSPPLRGLARAALAGAGVTLVLAPVVTIPSVVEACARFVSTVHAQAPLAPVLLAIAAGYTAAPLLVSALVARSEQDWPEQDWLAGGLKLSLLYALLIAPVVYLECVSLPGGIAALWMVGATMGAGAAGPLGVRLGERLRRAA